MMVGNVISLTGIVYPLEEEMKYERVEFIFLRVFFLKYRPQKIRRGGNCVNSFIKRARKNCRS